MTTEEKFNAAVNVIRSLPKNGSYQPSNELMLRFYAYFKQATQGPCTSSRPPFWDIVGRAKYDAYKGLGNMTKQAAMKHYVDELHRIVETMSYSDKVESFLEAPPNNMDSLNMADLEMIVGDVLERVRSRSNSPDGSRDASPNRMVLNGSSTASNMSISGDDTDHSDEEYIDSVDVPEPKRHLENNVYYQERIANGYGIHKDPTKIKVKNVRTTIDISQEISDAVHKLRLDLEKLSYKVNALESSAKSAITTNKTRRNFLSNIPPHFIAFTIMWPFIASFVIQRFLHRK